MQIILLERIGKLGNLGDVVKVKDGFARNFLLPQKKALRATKKNLERFELDREDLEKRNAQLKVEADTSGASLDGKSFIIIRQAGDTGQLYGSVATRDIAEAVSSEGVTVKRNQVILDRPIKLLGLHDIRVALHSEVTINIKINVARTDDEAERQERGEDVTAEDFDDGDDEDAVDVDEIFDDEDRAKQASEEIAEAEAGDDQDDAGGESAADEGGVDDAGNAEVGEGDDAEKAE